jgi:hypothetical protein
VGRALHSHGLKLSFFGTLRAHSRLASNRCATFLWGGPPGLRSVS